MSDPLWGRVLDNKYRLDAQIGAGGMATIYRATRLQIADSVAIKILHPELLRESKFAERFQREAQAAARLKHPNVVSIYDFGVSQDGVIYLVMELVEGQNLRTLIKDQGPMTTTAAAAIVRQVCAALGEAHRQNIIHRDIKPANIAISESPDGVVVKVLDFGIASLRGGATMMTFTQTGAVLGTPAYMSPEQCLGEELDSRSDIYSLGVVLFEMLSGVVPFNSPTATAVVMQHVQQAPPPLRVLNASIPAAVETVVLRALAKRREDRQQTARDFANEFNAAVAGIATPPRAENVSNAGTGLFAGSQSAQTMIQAPFGASTYAAPPNTASAQDNRKRGLIAGAAIIALIGVIWLAAQWGLSQRVQAGGAGSVSQIRAKSMNAPQIPSRSSTRFTTTVCGSIVDTSNKLEWLVGPDNNFTWDSAKTWVSSATACSGGWRMPYIDELASLYDPKSTAGIGFNSNGVHYPAHMDPIFSAIGSGSWVWSRESKGINVAESFNFNQGVAVEYEKLNTTYTTRVFGVRDPSPSHEPNVDADVVHLVRRYYGLWNDHRLAEAYQLLSARYRANHPYFAWANTHNSVVNIDATASRTDDPMTAAVVIKSLDRTDAGTTSSQYKGTWSAISENGRLKLDSASLDQMR